jgi:hypothetical protein
MREFGCRYTIEISDHWSRLLGARCEWPTSGDTANERDEIPSPHRATFQPEDNNLPYQARRRDLARRSKNATLDFRFGSKADIGARPIDVRFTPINGMVESTMVQERSGNLKTLVAQGFLYSSVLFEDSGRLTNKHFGVSPVCPYNKGRK